MTDTNVYFTGFAIAVAAELEVNGRVLSADELAACGTITAALVKPDRTGLATGSTVVTCTIQDATVVATWSAAQSAAITPGRYLVEFRTTVGPYCHEGVIIDLLAGVSP